MPDEIPTRISCSRRLIVELARRLGVNDGDPDDVLEAALDRIPAKGEALWKADA